MQSNKSLFCKDTLLGIGELGPEILIINLDEQGNEDEKYYIYCWLSCWILFQWCLECVFLTLTDSSFV